MTTNQHNLSGEKVEFDLERLIEVAAHGARNAKSQMERYEGIIQDALKNSALAGDDEQAANRHRHTAAFYANLMADTTKQYADALDTYHILVASKTRETVTIK